LALFVLASPKRLMLLATLLAAEVGVAGSGFTVAEERALSVLELFVELKREVASFLVMVYQGLVQASGLEPFPSSEGGRGKEARGLRSLLVGLLAIGKLGRAARLCTSNLFGWWRRR
jgi:hypothetical protein